MIASYVHDLALSSRYPSRVNTASPCSEVVTLPDIVTYLYANYHRECSYLL